MKPLSLFNSFLPSIVILLCVLASVLQARAQEKRSRIPTQSEQSKSNKKIKSLFKDAYSDSSPQGAQARIQQFLKIGSETNDSPADQYALLNVAREEAISIGDVSNGIKASEAIARHFDVNLLSLKTETLSELAGNISDVNSANRFLDLSQAIMDQYVREDNYDRAKKTLSEMQSVARKGRLQWWNGNLKAKSKSLRLLTKAYKSIDDSLYQLKIKPNDFQANETVGRFYCLQKSDFSKGLDILSRGEPNSILCKTAKAESQADSPDKKVAVADQWWELGTSTTPNLRFNDAEKRSLTNHAAEIYREVLDAVKGLEQKRIQERLVQYTFSAGGEWLKRLTSQKWSMAWSGQTDWKEARFGRDGIVSVSLANGNTGSYSWFSISEMEIQVVNPADRTHVIKMAADGTLVGRRFATSSGKPMGTGRSVPIKK